MLKKYIGMKLEYYRLPSMLKKYRPQNRNGYEFGTRQGKGLSFHSIEENRGYPCFFSRRHLTKLIFQWGPLWP